MYTLLLFFILTENTCIKLSNYTVISVSREILCIQNRKFIGICKSSHAQQRVNTVNCVLVCTVYTTCWSECGDNNAQRSLSRRLNSATRSRPGRIAFLYVPSVIWSRRHRRHGKITKGILVMGRWRLHDLTRIPSHFPLLFPPRCNDLRNCAPICNIGASKEANT